MADKHYIPRLPWGGASCTPTRHFCDFWRDKFLSCHAILEREDLREYIMSHGTDRILSDFGKSVMALAERLEENPPFGLIEQVFIENHMHIIQSAYSTWKRRHLRKASGE